MANIDLVQLIGLLNSNNITRAQNTLIQNRHSYIYLLNQLLSIKQIPSISENTLKNAKKSSSIALNYLFQRGIHLSGIEKVQFFWNIMFDWDMGMQYKINLQKAFTKLLQYGQLNNEMVFEEGVSAMIACLIQYGTQQGLQEISKLIALKQGEKFLLTFHHYQNIHNTILSLLFICRCCITTLRNKTNKQEYFRNIATIIVTLLKLIRTIFYNHQLMKAQYELIGWAFQCCQQMQMSQQQIKLLTNQFYANLSIENLTLEIFKKGSTIHRRGHKQLCWICIDQEQELLMLKIMAAQIYLQFTNNLCKQTKINHLLQKEQNLTSLLFTVSCYTSSQLHHSHPKSIFISLLLEIYVSYFSPYPNIFQGLHKICLQLFVFPLVRIDQNYLSIFQDDPQRYLDLLHDCWEDQRQNIPMVKAAKILRYVVQHSQHIYYQIIEIIIALFKNNICISRTIHFQICTQFQPNFQTAWIFLIAISPLLQQDQQNMHKIIAMIEKGAQIMLSDLSLTLIAFFLRTIINNSTHSSIKGIFNDFLIQGLNRNNEFIQSFMGQLQIQTIQVCFSWDLVELIFIKLLMRKQNINNHINWNILIKSLQFHSQKFDNYQLLTILTYAKELFFTQLKIQGIQDRTCIVKILQLVGIIIINSTIDTFDFVKNSIIDFFKAYEHVNKLSFREQIISLVALFFKKEQSFLEKHNQILKIAIKAYKQSNQNHLSCLQIFNRMICLGRHNPFSPSFIILQALLTKIDQYIGKQQMIQCLYADLLTVQYILHQTSIDKSTLATIISKVNKIESSIIQARVINIMLASRIHSKAQTFNWSFIIAIYNEKRLSQYEQRLTLFNIRKFIDNVNFQRNWQDYASVLTILYQIHKYSDQYQHYLEFVGNSQDQNRLDINISQISPFKLTNQHPNLQIKLIFKDIFKRKNFVYHFIQQELSQEVADYFRNIQMELIDEDQKQDYRDN